MVEGYVNPFENENECEKISSHYDIANYGKSPSLGCLDLIFEKYFGYHAPNLFTRLVYMLY
jgi:hypothetical protein